MQLTKMLEMKIHTVYKTVHQYLHVTVTVLSTNHTRKSTENFQVFSVSYAKIGKRYN
jgi:hypothetical protein